MADARTGLGQTIQEFQTINGDTTLHEAYSKADNRYRRAKSTMVQLGEMSVDDDVLHVEPGLDVDLDAVAYEAVCRLLKIPYAYLMRLDRRLRKQNVEFWLDHDEDKQAEIVTRGRQLVEIRANDEIEVVDVLGLLDAVVEDGVVFRVSHAKSSTMVDVYSPSMELFHGSESWFGGLRVNVRTGGLKAPEVSPIFLNESSCGIVECSQFMEPLNVKSLSYDDVLRVIDERMRNCWDAVPRLFSAYEKIADVEIPNPRRRISLYCREHAVPDRVRAYALAQFDESGLQSADYEDLICLFACLGYIEEVKRASEVKVQRLAGYIVSKALVEHRCELCDSQIVEDD